MTVSGATDATTLKNCIDFRKLTVFFNFLKFDKNYLRHITSTTTLYQFQGILAFLLCVLTIKLPPIWI